MKVEENEVTFDPKEWWDRIGPLQPDSWGNWITRDVIGPRDACWVLPMRELVGPYVSFGPPTPADLFLLSVGEAPIRDCTKIGGLPFWAHGRDWPRSSTGEPLPFLAQFCFRESIDIVGSLPGDLLLLFGDKDCPSTVVARWESSTCHSRLVDRNDMPVEPVVPCFYGSRWTTENYPDAQYADLDLLPDGTRVSDVWFICELLGMQIGSQPYFPRWSGRPDRTERVVCGMASVFPIPDTPHPFMNRSQPLTRQEADDLAFDLTNRKDADGFGVLCVVVADSGEPIVFFENL